MHIYSLPKTFLIIFLLPLLAIIGCENNKEAKNSENAEKLQKPNIVFIMTDDHAAQAISAYGHPVSQLAPTPNIDRIANNGAKFLNNFCTNSICGPSRAVILTGKFSHINGFRMNGEVFDGSQPTLPKFLKEAGYQTAIVGKWHLHGRPQGFDYWNILNDQGNYYNPEFIHQNDTTIVNGYATDIITDMGIDWMETKRKKDEPFFLMVHHKAPHRNWMPPIRHINTYDSITFPLPDSYLSKHEGQVAAQQQLQTIYEDMYEGHDLKMTVSKGSDSLRHNPWTSDFDRMTKEQRQAWNNAYRPKNDAFHDANLQGRELAKWKGQRYLRDYMGTVKAVDEGVGKILDYLEKNNLTENTLIVYTTDQGFYLGEKGFFDKRFMYEESLAMPLLMQYPKAIEKGITIDALTQNLDFAPTFLDFAGAEIPDSMQGKSLRPLLNNKTNAGGFRDAVYYHYYDFPAFHMVKRHYGIRTERYKLIHFYDDIDTWELYDLKKDPKEENNLYGDPAYAEIQQKLHLELKQLQEKYEVTEKEFQTTPKEKVDQAYRNFARLAGEDPETYPEKKSIEVD
ncbi:putative sulfatase [Christiangramia gaetbulicola]|uniref:Putative sulfatase n=1 Tax=Christiangramia gaetbulicola TaxID=703340 RepID=A0A2T6AKB8_9FLAO|nr:sulfatase [Christiangramia gaetbulicola]PTX44264.1 putative sulfatase [Christiangramia gaetbulicola]